MTTKMRPGTIVEETTETRTRLMPMYRVLIHNDDKTPFDFVIGLLMHVWRMQPDKAIQITMEAHKTGVGLVAVEPLERAEFHVDAAHSLARTQKFPLKFTYEPEG